MEYRRFDNVIIMRVDPEEEICEQLMEVAQKENITFAEISGLGAVKKFTTGVFNPVEKEYHANHFQGAFEIVSLSGTLTRKEDQPYLHVHMSAGDEEGKVWGGHLNHAVVSATAEVVIRIIDGKIDRQMSEKIGLNLFSFDDKECMGH